MDICIVGGGTAGWIAAYFLANDHCHDHNITVIESSDIGIIGAGEGSTGTMVELLNGTYFNRTLPLDEFLKKTNGTKKLGIYHQNWKGNGTGYFAPVDMSPTWSYYEDYIFKFVLAHFDKKKQHLSSKIGIDYEFNLDLETPALHFDGRLVGEYFKEICTKDGIEVIDDVVEDIICNSDGYITELKLKSKKIINADFFIDCTGLAQILGKKIGCGWNSYSDVLPMNSAIPFQQEYGEGEQRNPFTKATALSSGWMWEIPLQTRKGCGYVFDNRFISKEKAIQEVEQYLGKEIDPIKYINFDAGRSEFFWKKNVLMLGLSAAFVEPLEATSIHSTIIQLILFSKEFLLENFEETNSESAQESYNKKISILYDNIKDFISFHYQGGRDDTEFWKYIQNENIVSHNAAHFLQKSKKRIPGFLDLNGIVGSPAVGLWNWISAGLDIIDSEQALRELEKRQDVNTIRNQYKGFLNQISPNGISIDLDNSYKGEKL